MNHCLAPRRLRIVKLILSNWRKRFDWCDCSFARWLLAAASDSFDSRPSCMSTRVPLVSDGGSHRVEAIQKAAGEADKNRNERNHDSEATAPSRCRDGDMDLH